MMGAMILLGNVSGALAGTTFTRIGVLTIYAIMIGIVVTSVLITVFSITETYVKQTELEPLSFKVVFIGFWKPLKDHDFRWVFITRFLMQQGVATITGFLEYWLNDMVALPYCWTAATLGSTATPATALCCCHQVLATSSTAGYWDQLSQK
ncbi:uncharacterized protein LOC131943967 [Physella acuta]|uniref:uncharacterized protein LOC131943967 n=1 Tax=Physella acuta TaxID=109671 RepID=UPI0027DCB261|nr:uncharacterized protein LOC131943967 [Physella acuta]